jgi:ribonuclease HI
VKFKAGLGPESNDYAEFQALKLLLKGALDRNVKHIQIFDDSSLVINWMNGSGQLHNVLFRPVGDLLQEVSTSFVRIYFTDVSRKLNEKADKLSKEGQQMLEGSMAVGGVKDGVSVTTLISI